MSELVDIEAFALGAALLSPAALDVMRDSGAGAGRPDRARSPAHLRGHHHPGRRG